MADPSVTEVLVSAVYGVRCAVCVLIVYVCVLPVEKCPGEKLCYN